MKGKLLLFVLVLLQTATTGMARTNAERAIREMLQAQVMAWNNGNIEGYMHGYWENDSLLFIGSKGPRYGYQVTLKRYQEAYPDSTHMGKLTSTVTRIQKLSARYYFVVGKWALQRSVGDLSGSYTLLLHRVGRKWVIIADHSS